MNKNVLVLSGLFIIAVIVGAAFLIAPQESGATAMFYKKGQATTPEDGLTIFVTSRAYTGSLGGLVGADTICHMAADQAGLEGSFTVLLSDSTQTARTRFNTRDNPYYDANGNLIADNFEKLVGMDIENPVQVTESGDVLTAYTEVWTGTQAGGIASSENTFCGDWGSESGLLKGSYGQTSWTDSSWLEMNKASCDSEFHLYCVQNG